MKFHKKQKAEMWDVQNILLWSTDPLVLFANAVSLCDFVKFQL